MKKCLMMLVALSLMATIIPVTNAGSPQECRKLLHDVLKKQGLTYHKISTDPKALAKFKATAKVQGDWGKFMTACSNPNYKGCEFCQCPTGLGEKTCSLNCGCCWGETKCSK